ncbi:hypothetical protein BDF20DRAFT_888838 [Mycotypha africana]|uniref:uncharacterized protein n=1 Tax=Mycotypha africana TaxID=64632 RepID=UPI0023010B82|nr:uncharacterized protein BDF20DRAFT_888838 [Mycotypha africana]KAI8970004.1 hypothetical protein BDF20DRAFT_888838 [Mycotypha africana]
MSASQTPGPVDELTPPREYDDDEFSEDHDRKIGEEQESSSLSINYNNAADLFRLLQARLQYAQIKLETGLSTENLQQIERSFITSPRQPRRPLPSEYPPTPQSSTPQSRKVKRMLLSAMTPSQNSWRRKKRVRHQQQIQEESTDLLEEEEDAARTILMLGASRSYSPSNTSPETPKTNILQQHSSTSPEFRIRRRKFAYDTDQEEEEEGEGEEEEENQHQPRPDLFAAVAKIPNYEEKSRQFAQSILRRRSQQLQDKPPKLGKELPPLSPAAPPPPPAIVSRYDNASGSTYQYYEYDRPLPPPPPYSHKYRQSSFHDEEQTRGTTQELHSSVHEPSLPSQHAETKH